MTGFKEKSDAEAHQGDKLKSLVEKSGIKIKTLLKESGVTRGSLYNFYKYDEIPQKKLTPLLRVLEMDIDAFYGYPNYSHLLRENEVLKREIEMLKYKLADKEEIIVLLKSKRK